jgi:type II restriction/modification system DNA methylase subunit YeeA
MDTTKLKRFAQHARRLLLDQVKAKLDLVLAQDSAARRENPSAVKQLEEQIAQTSKAQVIDKVAYTWFNRFCALRFMDLNGYSKIRVVSPADESQFLPEVLAEAKQGHMDEDRVPEKIRQRVDALLSGKAPSHDPQQEAYRLLVVAECNAFHQAMPYLFERIADYTELLMPDDLLSGNSVLAYARESMTPDACQDVEVIGWLYQFYISEKKDQVFEGLKKNQKISPENIPAATQLFTPHWIVRYLVENSLGRLWMLNHPGSPLAGQMDYYIAPEQPETDFLKINKPEDIKVCDPACGSGHMLTYAFDLLYAIYEEVGTDPGEIPEKILNHNLFGIEIDERAGELAAFALAMKARAKSRRFFNKGIKPNICVLQKVTFDADELSEYMDAVGRDLFTLDLRETLQQFADVDNLGSLITPKLASVATVLTVLQAKDMVGNLFLANTHAKVLEVLHMAEYLSPRYAVVVANPPYMGSKGMNGKLSDWAKTNYPKSKSDLFAMFIERNLDMVVPQGAVAMITMQSWMFLSSYEALRGRILNQNTILSMAHLGARAFDSIGGEVVSTTAFVLEKKSRFEYNGIYLRLVSGDSESEKSIAIREAIKNLECGWRFLASSADFNKIQGNPIVYWVSKTIYETFINGKPLTAVAKPVVGLQTGENARFVRAWHEVSADATGLSITSRLDAKKTKKKWFPYNKGGEFYKWYGNQEFVVNWEDDGHAIKNFKDEKGKPRSYPRNLEHYFCPSVSWSKISSALPAFRYYPSGFIFDVAGTSIFQADQKELFYLLGFCNSKVAVTILQALSPTLNFEVGHIGSLPILGNNPSEALPNIHRLVESARSIWNSLESSWDFTDLPLLNPNFRQTTLKAIYQNLRVHWHEMTLKMQRLEQENNRIFIDVYGLSDELTPEVPLSEITLTCNPHYRYGDDKTEEELEVLLLADTMREFISYAVGCMFGRYALDKPGLVLANQGESLTDYLAQVPQPSFPADEDNVIPMLDGEWFADDVTERFRQFLRVTFGDAHYDENLAFIEQALNVKGKRNYTLRDYMLGEFYADHVKRYKKRPIYWLFSSPKGTFNALIYLHRYRPDTASVVLRYLRDFRAKLAARQSTLEQVLINPATSQGEKTRANKEIDTLKKQIIELQDYENDSLYPLATAQVAIDLDDGVKVNYLKLGAALKKIPGLDAKEED